MSATLTRDAGTPALRGRLSYDEPLARRTSWRVGGPAERCYRPADVDDLAAFLAGLPAGEPVFWLGLGSNVLIRDGGLPGTVVLTAGLLDGIGLAEDGTLRVQAGVTCARLARFAARHGLTGVEFLAGIPGTLGGALAMNAGAWGGETWQHVERVETLDRAGQRRVRPRADYRVGYREVHGPPASGSSRSGCVCPRGTPRRRPCGCARCCGAGRRPSPWGRRVAGRCSATPRATSLAA